MSSVTNTGASLMSVAFAVIVGLLVAIALILIFFVAPTESTMGDVQRIIYLHVAVAWCGLAAMVAMSLCGAMYLVRRGLEWDFWSQACNEVGFLCALLTLMTGSAWAHEAWGTWWTWEPRLASSLVLWVLYAGILLVRSGLEDPHRRARVAAVLAVVGIGDVPLVLMATRWFRGVHPVAPDMDPRMQLVLLISVISFTVLFAYLVAQRRRQLQLAEWVAQFDAPVDHQGTLSQRRRSLSL